MNSLSIVAAITAITAITASIFAKRILNKWNEDYDEELHHNVAVHESGHALIYYLLFNKVPFYMTNKLNLNFKSRGFASYVIHLERIEDCEKYVMVCYGGSVAEELVFGFVDIGASSDKEEAHRALTIVSKTKNKYCNENSQGFYLYDKLEEYYDKTTMYLEVNQDILKNLSDNLLKHRILLQRHIKTILENKELKITTYDKICMLYVYYFKYMYMKS